MLKFHKYKKVYAMHAIPSLTLKIAFLNVLQQKTGYTSKNVHNIT